MFDKRTLFITGAGCSFPFEFPLGYTLRDDIFRVVSQEFSTLYNSPLGIAFQMYALGQDTMNRCLKAQHFIKQGVYSRPSIDQFLDYHSGEPEVVMLGKLIIAQTIIAYERASPLKKEPQTRGDWLERVFHIASEDTNPQNIEDMFKDLRFVTFNYDRCIEHYLYAQTLGLVGGDVSLAKRICANLNVVHAYGCVGPVPWRSDYTRTLEFGSPPLESQNLLSAAQGLKLFTERAEPHAESNSARFQVLNAEVMRSVASALSSKTCAFSEWIRLKICRSS